MSQMKRQRIVRDSQTVTDRTRSRPGRAVLHEYLEDFQPRFLGKRGERDEGMIEIHMSIVMDTTEYVNRDGQIWAD